MEHNFVKKSSFELLQNEVIQLRAQVEVMAHAQAKAHVDEARRKVVDHQGRKWREESQGNSRPGVGILRMGSSHPYIVATIPFPDVRFRALLDYRLYRLADVREDVDSYDRKMMSAKKKAMYH